MDLFDTHCHIDVDTFAENCEQVLAGARAAGVTSMVLPGVVRDSWRRLMTLCASEHGLYGAPGLHPMYLRHHRPHHLTELETLARSGSLTAIGEIGLDYHVADVNREDQQRLFEAQLQIADTARLPILLHVRKAHDQVLATLRRTKFSHGGIVHAFSGSLQQANQYIQLGFGISVCGTITYDRARRIRAVARELPRQSIVLESDAPDIPPRSHHGENNYPEYLPEIALALADLRNERSDDVAGYTTANARRILGLD